LRQLATRKKIGLDFFAAFATWCEIIYLKPRTQRWQVESGRSVLRRKSVVLDAM